MTMIYKLIIESNEFLHRVIAQKKTLHEHNTRIVQNETPIRIPLKIKYATHCNSKGIKKYLGIKTEFNTNFQSDFSQSNC